MSETIGLPPDDEGPVVATLVSAPASASTREPRSTAVLHLHGFSDYFFQAEYAGWWLERGYDFYALDLRKYGRSLREHQTATYVDDLHSYFAEIDLAVARIIERDGHDAVLVSAHSTGGLVAPLWAQHRPDAPLAGLVLNSPWFDLQGKPVLRSAGMGRVIEQLGRRAPMRELPRNVSGFYARSLHREHEGEWDFDLSWKPVESFPVRFGWLRAVRRGHAELHAGLDISAPVLVLSSAESGHPRELDESVHSSDIVLDVEQIRRWAPAVGTHVTYVAIPGARHDVVLSRSGPRARVYDELGRWVGAYLEPSTTPGSARQEHDQGDHADDDDRRP